MRTVNKLVGKLNLVPAQIKPVLLKMLESRITHDELNDTVHKKWRVFKLVKSISQKDSRRYLCKLYS